MCVMRLSWFFTGMTKQEEMQLLCDVVVSSSVPVSMPVRVCAHIHVYLCVRLSFVPCRVCLCV